MCRNYLETGICNFGDGCPFAHGQLDLSKNSCYKTALCRHFSTHGSCPMGKACQFSHGVDELRPKNNFIYVVRSNKRKLSPD